MTANQETTRGNVHLADIHHVRAIHDGTELRLSCVDAKGVDVLRLKSSESTTRDEWVAAMSDMLVFHSEEIQRTLGKSEKERRRRERQDEVEDRRRLAKARISKLGLEGMKYSAVARAKR